MRVMHQVTCCDDCPLLSENAYCQHPTTRQFREEGHRPSIWADENDPDVSAPKWCPLRAGELLITLRAKS